MEEGNARKAVLWTGYAMEPGLSGMRVGDDTLNESFVVAFWMGGLWGGT